MSNFMIRPIKNKYPDYDENRHHFKFGDVVKTNSHAIIFVKESLITHVEALVLKPGFGLKMHEIININYSELPYYDKGKFESKELKIYKGLNWKVGDVVIDPRSNFKILLYEDRERGGFYGWVLECDDPFYKETGIYINNPYKDYISL